MKSRIKDMIDDEYINNLKIENSFAPLNLVGKMVKLAPRVFLLCWLLFSLNISFMYNGQAPIILL